MSRITRRMFLQTICAVAGSTTLAACSWTTPAIQFDGVTPTELTIWSTVGSADSALARWRRLNPDITVRRQTLNSNTLLTALQQLHMRNSNLATPPDIIITDTYTLLAADSIDLWRHAEIDLPNEFVPATIPQTQVDANSMYAYTLTVNPLKIWYHSEIINDALNITEPNELITAMGSSWDSFNTCIQQIQRNYPSITAVSSCFDDMCFPIYLHSLTKNLPLMDALRQSFGLAQRHVVGRAIHFSGQWFDLVNRNNVAMIVGGRGMGQAIQRTATNEQQSPWRTVTHPFGTLFGPGIVAAIPIQSSRYEHAIRLINDFRRDTEYQLLISNQSGNMPVHVATYGHAELQKADPINPTQSITVDWNTLNVTNGSKMQSFHIAQLQTLKNTFYAWQSGEITDTKLLDTLTYFK